MTEGRDDGEAKNQEPGFFAAVGNDRKKTGILRYALNDTRKERKDRDSLLRSG
jgi:hypothetical protein